MICEATPRTADGLLDLWPALRDAYGLVGVSCVGRPELRAQGLWGRYTDATRTIALADCGVSVRSILTLLHEIRHAMQGAARLLGGQTGSWSVLWRFERDAEAFAYREYDRLFAAYTGPPPPYQRWEHKRALRSRFLARLDHALAYAP